MEFHVDFGITSSSQSKLSLVSSALQALKSDSQTSKLLSLDDLSSEAFSESVSEELLASKLEELLTVVGSVGYASVLLSLDSSESSA